MPLLTSLTQLMFSISSILCVGSHQLCAPSGVPHRGRGKRSKPFTGKGGTCFQGHLSNYITFPSMDSSLEPTPWLPRSLLPSLLTGEARLGPSFCTLLGAWGKACQGLSSLDSWMKWTQLLPFLGLAVYSSK